MTEHPVPVPTALVLYIDPVFAPLDRDHQLERVGGGFETDVYRSDDRRWAVKLKHDGWRGPPDDAPAHRTYAPGRRCLCRVPGTGPQRSKLLRCFA